MNNETFLIEFEKISAKIREIVNSDSLSPTKEGKLTAKLIEILKMAKGDEYVSTPCSRKIMTHYKVRRTKEGEYHRLEKYLGDFDFKKSEAYKIITSMTKYPNDKYVETLVNLVVEEEKKYGNNMKPAREVFRSKAALYKFIQDNLDVFKQYFAEGTTIVTD